MKVNWSQPLVWCWLFIAVWVLNALAAAYAQRWEGFVIAMFGLLGAILVTLAVTSRRRKNLYPRDQEGVTHSWPS